MRIGEFAKQYDMNPSAIRYYIDKALLTPKRNNGQYDFDARCHDQMRKIQKYKDMRFTLEEIELLFYYEGLSGLKDPDVVERILSMLHGKKEQLDAETLQLDRIRETLEYEIKSMQQISLALSEDSPDPSQAMVGQAWMPLDALGMLRCPVCGSVFSLTGAEIDPKGVREGRLCCSCGHETQIDGGVLLCDGASEESPFRAFENVNSVLATTEDFSPAYRTLIEKGHLWIYQQIIRYETGLGTILAGPFSYNFLLKHLKGLPESWLFIIIDPSIRKIRKLQDYFSGYKHQILFIAGDIKSVPLKKEVIDLYIDDFCGNNFTFTYNDNLLKHIAPLLRPGGLLTGHFVDYTLAPKSLRAFREDHPTFRPELMGLQRTRRNFSEAGISILEEIDHGSPEGKQRDFIRQVDEEKVSLITYLATK